MTTLTDDIRNLYPNDKALQVNAMLDALSALNNDLLTITDGDIITTSEFAFRAGCCSQRLNWNSGIWAITATCPICRMLYIAEPLTGERYKISR